MGCAILLGVFEGECIDIQAIPSVILIDVFLRCRTRCRCLDGPNVRSARTSTAPSRGRTRTNSRHHRLDLDRLFTTPFVRSLSILSRHVAWRRCSHFSQLRQAIFVS